MSKREKTIALIAAVTVAVGFFASFFAWMGSPSAPGKVVGAFVNGAGQVGIVTETGQIYYQFRRPVEGELFMDAWYWGQNMNALGESPIELKRNLK